MFLGVGVGLVFFDGVLPRFLLYNLVSRSRKCPAKILLMSGLPFWDRSTRQPYCHTCVAVFSPFSKGEMLSIFLFLFLSGKFGVLCFIFLLFFSSWGRCWE